MIIKEDVLKHNIFYYLSPVIVLFLFEIYSFFPFDRGQNIENIILFSSVLLTFPISIFVLSSIFENVFFLCSERKIFSSFLSLVFIYFIFNSDIFFNILQKVFYKNLSLFDVFTIYMTFLFKCLNAIFLIGFCLSGIFAISKLIFEGTSLIILKRKMTSSYFMMYVIIFTFSLLIEKIFTFIVDGGLEIFV